MPSLRKEFEEALKSNNKQHIRELLGNDPHQTICKINEKDITGFGIAIRNSNTEMVKFFLQDLKVLESKQDIKNEANAICHAARRGYYEIMYLILRNTAQRSLDKDAANVISGRDHVLLNAIFGSIGMTEDNRYDMVYLLLEHGAYPLFKKDGFSLEEHAGEIYTKRQNLTKKTTEDIVNLIKTVTDHKFRGELPLLRRKVEDTNDIRSMELSDLLEALQKLSTILPPALKLLPLHILP